ncbi:hypothetical protein HDV00_009089 [Rhizophlyctis rosea]|nr:hypothetical protein HDV00_009089 [Rhizophlyctis rosea]
MEWSSSGLWQVNGGQGSVHGHGGNVSAGGHAAPPNEDVESSYSQKVNTTISSLLATLAALNNATPSAPPATPAVLSTNVLSDLTALNFSADFLREVRAEFQSQATPASQNLTQQQPLLAFGLPTANNLPSAPVAVSSMPTANVFTDVAPLISPSAAQTLLNPTAPYNTAVNLVNQLSQLNQLAQTHSITTAQWRPPTLNQPSSSTSTYPLPPESSFAPPLPDCDQDIPLFANGSVAHVGSRRSSQESESTSQSSRRRSYDAAFDPQPNRRPSHDRMYNSQSSATSLKQFVPLHFSKQPPTTSPSSTSTSPSKSATETSRPPIKSLQNKSVKEHTSASANAVTRLRALAADADVVGLVKELQKAQSEREDELLRQRTLITQRHARQRDEALGQELVGEISPEKVKQIEDKFRHELRDHDMFILDEMDIMRRRQQESLEKKPVHPSTACCRGRAAARGARPGAPGGPRGEELEEVEGEEDREVEEIEDDEFSDDLTDRASVSGSEYPASEAPFEMTAATEDVGEAEAGRNGKDEEGEEELRGREALRDDYDEESSSEDGQEDATSEAGTTQSSLSSRSRMPSHHPARTASPLPSESSVTTIATTGTTATTATTATRATTATKTTTASKLTESTKSARRVKSTTDLAIIRTLYNRIQTLERDTHALPPPPSPAARRPQSYTPPPTKPATTTTKNRRVSFLDQTGPPSYQQQTFAHASRARTVSEPKKVGEGSERGVRGRVSMGDLRGGVGGGAGEGRRWR